MIVKLIANNNGCVVEMELDDDDLEGYDKREALTNWSKEITAQVNTIAGGIVDFNKVEKNPNAPATDNQKYTMDRFGIKYTKSISYAEASRLISKSMEENKTK